MPNPELRLVQWDDRHVTVYLVLGEEQFRLAALVGRSPLESADIETFCGEWMKRADQHGMRTEMVTQIEPVQTLVAPGTLERIVGWMGRRGHKAHNPFDEQPSALVGLRGLDGKEVGG